MTDGEWTPTAIARAGALHLADLVRKSGRFIYAYRLGGEPLGGYNIVRHCGAIWAMAEVANTLPDLDRVRLAAHRALGWLLEEKTAWLGRGLCPIGSKDVTKLGGAALAALACLEVSKGVHEADLVRKARAFGNYIAMMYMPNGQFLHKVDMDRKKVTAFRSDFYTGQALYALAQLYNETRDHRWRDIAIECTKGLSECNYGVDIKSHWMLYALSALSRAGDRDFCIDYGKRIVDAMLEDTVHRYRRKSTPTACRSEGLLAFLDMTQGTTDPGLRETCDQAQAMVEANLLAQQFFFRPSGAFICSRKEDDVRIDYIQHNITSFLRYGLLRQQQQA